MISNRLTGSIFLWISALFLAIGNLVGGLLFKGSFSMVGIALLFCCGLSYLKKNPPELKSVCTTLFSAFFMLMLLYIFAADFEVFRNLMLSSGTEKTINLFYRFFSVLIVLIAFSLILMQYSEKGVFKVLFFVFSFLLFFFSVAAVPITLSIPVIAAGTAAMSTFSYVILPVMYFCMSLFLILFGIFSIRRHSVNAKSALPEIVIKKQRSRSYSRKRLSTSITLFLAAFLSFISTMLLSIRDGLPMFIVALSIVFCLALSAASYLFPASPSLRAASVTTAFISCIQVIFLVTNNIAFMTPTILAYCFICFLVPSLIILISLSAVYSSAVIRIICLVLSVSSFVNLLWVFQGTKTLFIMILLFILMLFISFTIMASIQYFKENKIKTAGRV